MRTQDALVLEDMCIEDASDMALPMTLTELQFHSDEILTEGEELGLRTLHEYPEALSKSFRRQLQ